MSVAKETALNATGKPVQKGDFVSISGLVTAVSGTGEKATLTVRTFNSGGTLSVQSNEVTSTQST